jgi:hypothetical protein
MVASTTEQEGFRVALAKANLGAMIEAARGGAFSP